MALREFRDGEGVEWIAWDVPPVREFSPVRSGEERRVNPTANYHPERRVLRDRRRRKTGAGLEHGWVCFQCEAEKRRLAPPPRDWEAIPDEQLAALCRNALPARHSAN
ncbi:MAG TPA: hypothetical protein VFS20_04975 [Longimicrobium sp.]|nr:hypothetical protein [Longimicrobium sp.]